MSEYLFCPYYVSGVVVTHLIPKNNPLWKV